MAWFRAPKVTLKDETKGNTQQDHDSNKDGAYRFYLLPPGPYTVTVSATGFSTQTATRCMCRRRPDRDGELPMVVGAVVTTVTVTEEAPLLPTDSGDMATRSANNRLRKFRTPETT